jgi:amino acid adenylation domain-containing protein
VGEYVAATIAGVFSLEDGLRLIAERGRLMQSLPKNGSMAAVFASLDEVNAAVAPYAESVSVAGVNGKTNIVISGEQQAMREILKKLSGQGVNTRSLTVSHAFHSPLMDPILDEFEQIASQVEFQPANIPLISNLTGAPLTEDIEAAYWRQHVRQAVQFQAGMQFLAESGCRFYLEVGPNPVLIGMGKRALSDYLDDKQLQVSWLPSAKQGQQAWETLLNSLGSLITSGYEVDWEAFERPYAGIRQRSPAWLPTYPFQGERHWFSDSASPARLVSLEAAQEETIKSIEPDQTPAERQPEQVSSLGGNGRRRERDEQLAESSAALLPPEKVSILTRAELESLNPTDRQAVLEENLRFYLGHVLHLDPRRIDLDRPIQFLGLDSIMAIELKGMVERSLGINLPIASLLQGPSVAQLATQISGQIGSPAEKLEIAAGQGGQPVDGGVSGSSAQIAEPALSGSTPGEVLAGIGEEQRDAEGTYPLSYGQQAMWIQHQMDPNSVFNPIYCVRVRSSVHRETLEQAVQILAQRHASLRTVFTYLDGSPRQRILAHGLIRLEVLPAQDLDDAEVESRLIEQANLPFDLETGPLMRIVLFTRRDQDHFLMLAAHHIITDLWSLAILINELGILYAYLDARASVAGDKNSPTGRVDAMGQGQNGRAKAGLPDLDNEAIHSILGPLPVQYTDYVQWQSRLLASRHGEKLWDYWRNKLHGDLPVIDLPADHPRPAVQSYHGATLARVLDSGLLERLQAFSESHGVTLYTTLLAAFNVLLYRYSGQEDLIIGTPTMGRSLAGLQDLAGYFVNPVALRSQLQAEMTFEQLLERVKQTVIEALDHQDFPFNLLVERLKPDRDPSRLPIFQVMFILQRAHLLNEQGLSQFAVSMDGLQMNLAGLQVESLALDTHKAQFDLTLIMAEAQGGLGASITYNTDLFETSSIERMLDHYQVVLENILNDAAQPVSQVNILTQPELQRLLVEFNETEELIWPEMRRDELVAHRIFEKQAALTPDAPAAIFEKEVLTYRQLNQKANRLAHYLQMMGVGPEKIVGICVDRSLDMIVAILAVMKAGGAYLPMDPVYPVDRLAFMIQDAKIPVLLTQLQLRDRLPTLVSQVLFLDINWEGQLKLILGLEPGTTTLQTQYDLGSEEGLEDNLDVPVRPDNLAYIIYTSGSTGRSKGVMIEHLGLVNTIWAQIKGFHIHPLTRQLQFASFSFDASISEIFTALLCGATICLARREYLLSLPDFIRLMKEYRVTSATLPPSLLAMLPEDDFPDLETIVSAGESCTPEIALRWAKGRKFVNAYGPTEVSIGPTYYQIDGRSLTGEDLERRAKGQIDGEQIKFSATVPIGRPIGNTCIYILNEHRQPVPVGMIGELYIGGIGVARGYLNRADLTADKFILDPFVSVIDPQSQCMKRLYRTGDLGRFLPDGNIEFLGRVDFQVKLRGFRIELEEIEAVLSQHPDVQQAVIQVRGDKLEEKRLVAFVIQGKGAAVGANDLREFLRIHLPEYMVPSAFIVVDKLPLTPSGKIDRRAVATIADTNAARPELEAAYVPPQTEVERLIAKIWQEVLNIERVGLNDNFFDLGGHSLLLYKAHGRMQEVFERSFSMVELFRYPTISALADFLNRDPQAVAEKKMTQNRADQQKDAMKRQVDRMREITRGRDHAATPSSSAGKEPLRPGGQPGLNPGARPGLTQKPVLRRSDPANKK